MKMILFFLLFTSFSLSFAQETITGKSAVGIVIQKSTFRTVCTGLAIHPRVVLTAGHCLQDLKEAWVVEGDQISSLDFKLSFGLNRHYVIDQKSFTQPQTDWTHFIDMGLLLLDEDLPQEMLEKIEFHSGLVPTTNMTFVRYGFGKRNKKNIKVTVQETFSNPIGSYFAANDTQGVGGDSGGPVFFENKLLGLHTGRSMDNEGHLFDYSFICPINNQELIQWINTEKETLLKKNTHD